MDENTLKIEEGRCTGRTTRLADHYIQQLFIEKGVIIRDHYNLRPAHQFLFDKVMKRLTFEHRVKTYFDKSLFIIAIDEDVFRKLKSIKIK